MKPTCISFLLVLFTITVHAQDKIYQRGGAPVIEAKVKKVGPETVMYVRFDNQSGPEYTISKDEIREIDYENGTVDKFRRDVRFPPLRNRMYGRVIAGRRDTATLIYSSNVLAFAPLQFSENGLGVSFSYEKALDKKGFVALYVPLIMTFSSGRNNDQYNSSTGTYTKGHRDMMLYAMPGVKIYPVGSYGIVRYAIGPSLVVATGQKTSSVAPSSSWTYITQDHTLLGAVLNNSININPTPHLYVGVEFGFGFTYVNQVNNEEQGTNGIVQGGFKIGYRF